MNSQLCRFYLFSVWVYMFSFMCLCVLNLFVWLCVHMFEQPLLFVQAFMCLCLCIFVSFLFSFYIQTYVCVNVFNILRFFPALKKLYVCICWPRKRLLDMVIFLCLGLQLASWQLSTHTHKMPTKNRQTDKKTLQKRQTTKLKISNFL